MLRTLNKIKNPNIALIYGVIDVHILGLDAQIKGQTGIRRRNKGQMPVSADFET